MKNKLKQLRKELKDWKSNDVKQRFDKVGSRLYVHKIDELQQKIKRYKLLQSN